MWGDTEGVTAPGSHPQREPGEHLTEARAGWENHQLAGLPLVSVRGDLMPASTRLAARPEPLLPLSITWTELDHATEDAAPSYRNFRVYQLGSGHLEVYYARTPWLGGRSSSGTRSPSRTAAAALEPEERERRQLQNRDRALRRAASQVRRLVLTHELAQMVTLTFAEEVTSWGAAWKDFTFCLRRVRRCRPGLRYVAVAAIQAERAARTGASVWHFHVAVADAAAAEELAAAWRHGLADVRAFTSQKGAPDPRSVARYLVWNLRSLAGAAYVGRVFRAATGMQPEHWDGLHAGRGRPGHVACVTVHRLRPGGRRSGRPDRLG